MKEPKQEVAAFSVKGMCNAMLKDHYDLAVFIRPEGLRQNLGFVIISLSESASNRIAPVTMPILQRLGAPCNDLPPVDPSEPLDNVFFWLERQLAPYLFLRGEVGKLCLVAHSRICRELVPKLKEISITLPPIPELEEEEL